MISLFLVEDAKDKKKGDKKGKGEEEDTTAQFKFDDSENLQKIGNEYVFRPFMSACSYSVKEIPTLLLAGSQRTNRRTLLKNTIQRSLRKTSALRLKARYARFLYCQYC